MTNLDELIYGTEPEPQARQHLGPAAYPFAMLHPSRHEASVFIQIWMHECHQAGTDPASGDLPDFAPSFQEVKNALGQNLGLEVSGAVDPFICQGVEDDATTMALDWYQTGIRLKGLLDQAANPYSGTLRQEVQTALSLVSEAVAEVGIERDERLREASQLFYRLIETPEAKGDALMHLCAGWTGFARGARDGAAYQSLLQACLILGPQSGRMGWLAGRTLASAESAAERWSEAGKAMEFSCNAAADPETHLEAARCLCASGRPEEARRHLELALGTQMSLAACVWAWPELAELRETAAQILQKAGSDAQSLCRAELANWQSQLAKIQQVEKATGLKVELVGALRDELPKVAGQAAKGALQASYVAQIAGDRARETLEFAQRSLTEQFDEALALVAKHRQALLEVTEDRDEELASAARRRDSARETVQARLTQMGDATQNLQSGCAWGLGIGCGGLAVYVAVVVVSGLLGRVINVDNPLSVVIFGLVGAPAAIMVLIQIGFSIKRLGIEAEVNVAMKAIQAEFDASVNSVNALLRDESAKLHRSLEKSEASARTVEKAFGLLGLPIPERTGWVASSADR